jgi:hypothetical protein
MSVYKVLKRKDYLEHRKGLGEVGWFNRGDLRDTRATKQSLYRLAENLAFCSGSSLAFCS